MRTTEERDKQIRQARPGLRTAEDHERRLMDLEDEVERLGSKPVKAKVENVGVKRNTG